jgi:2-hydroxychromene-2-carboxylate isomerase
MKNHLYFSFRSPYSWIAMRKLEERVPNAPEVIEYLPYWEPQEDIRTELDTRGSGFLYAPMSKAKHLYILRDIKNLTQQHGYAMTWPVDVNPRWDVPHLAWLAARRLGGERALFWALHRARWQEGRDIWHWAVVAEVADGVGLDGQAVVDAANSQEIQAEAVDILARAYDEDVFGVPFFFAGRQRFWGLDRLEMFIEALSAAGVPLSDEGIDIPAEVRQEVGCYDSDTAGGCG